MVTCMQNALVIYLQPTAGRWRQSGRAYAGPAAAKKAAVKRQPTAGRWRQSDRASGGPATAKKAAADGGPLVAKWSGQQRAASGYDWRLPLAARRRLKGRPTGGSLSGLKCS